MEINEIKIANEGYILCKSSFYSVNDILSGREFHFTRGINRLEGGIDSGIFGISYLLSMYNKIDKKTIFWTHEANVDGKIMDLSELTDYACYMDTSYPLFSSNQTVKSLIKRALSKTKLPYDPVYILDKFSIQSIHHNKPLKKTGNEKIKIMAAIGYCYGKQIFCFPWFSKMRFESFNKHMSYSLDVLASLGKIVILPIDRY